MPSWHNAELQLGQIGPEGLRHGSERIAKILDQKFKHGNLLTQELA
jgi:hypothetical protein